MTKHAASKSPDLSSMSRLSENCFAACQTWQEETARFLTKRFERDAELWHQLVGCGDWTEAVRLQQQWAAATAQDYIDQARRMTDLAGKFAPSAGELVPPAGVASTRQTHAA